MTAGRRGTCVAALLLCAAATLAAQDSLPSADRRAPSAGGAIPLTSMGLPPTWKPYVAGEATFGNTSTGTEFGGNATLGVYRDLLNPMFGALGIVGEGYVGGQSGTFEGGARLMAGIPVLFIQGGADFSFTRDRTDYILSLVFPVMRGGFWRRGGQVRIDWLPTRGETFNLGVQLPIFQPWVGRTRPYDLHVRIPEAPARPPPAVDGAIAPADLAAVDSAVREMENGAGWLARLSFVFWDDRGGNYQEGLQRAREDITSFKALLAATDALHPHGHSFRAEMALYHGAIARAFGRATSDPRVTDLAYAAILEGVIISYDRNFGQYKSPETLMGYGAGARIRFAFDLNRRPTLSRAQRAAALHVFDGWLATLETIRETIDEQSGDDSRLIWLPLQLGLREGDYDTQGKVDRVVERLVQQRFTTGNAALYVDNLQFQYELARMIMAAEDYHVLWIHDYAGVNAAGAPDSIGWAQTLVYLRALTIRVRAYDSTGKLPVYMIMADAFFTGTNKGALWLEMLERPLTRTVKLPAAFAGMEAALRAAQDSLRAAVAASTQLQAEAAVHGGERWLAERIRVYVNLTGPSDLTFRTSHLLGVAFMSDNLIRDHRKLAFRDVTERDPSKGEAIYTGVGVGQHYASATWEDRAMVLSGPALLTLKERAREELRMNGFTEAQIPPFLRAEPMPADYQQQVDRLVAAGATGEAMEVQNQVGFAQKDASISQMALYNLMPAGSVIIVPSSIWTSGLWAAQLGSAALRGCHVYIIAPSAKNASAGGKYLFSRQSEIFARLIEMSNILEPNIAAAGGALHVGIYDRDLDLTDVAGSLRRVAKAYREQPFLRAEFPFPASLYEYLGAAADSLSALGLHGQAVVGDVKKRDPLLHRKTQFFATRATLDAVAKDSGIVPMFRAAIVSQVRKRSAMETGPTYARPARELVKPVIRAFDALPDSLRARSVLYSAVGSINKDARGVYLDGEVYVLLAGSEALWTWSDYFTLFGWCTWVQSVQEMDSLVPPQGKVTRWVAWKIKRVL